MTVQPHVSLFLKIRGRLAAGLINVSGFIFCLLPLKKKSPDRRLVCPGILKTFHVGCGLTGHDFVTVVVSGIKENLTTLEGKKGCAEMWPHKSGLWNDVDCSLRRHYICQKKGWFNSFVNESIIRFNLIFNFFVRD